MKKVELIENVIKFIAGTAGIIGFGAVMYYAVVLMATIFGIEGPLR